MNTHLPRENLPAQRDGESAERERDVLRRRLLDMIRRNEAKRQHQPDEQHAETGS